MRRNFWLALLLMLSTLLGSMMTQALACDLADGRINARPHRDCGAPVAIFIQGSDVVVLGLTDTPDPDPLALRAPANGDIPTTANTIIGTGTNPVTGRPVILSRLTTGEYQLNTFFANGTPYVVVWYRGREDLYHLDPVTGAPLDGATSIVAPGATNPGAGSQNPAPIVDIPSSGGTSSTRGSSSAPAEIILSMPAAGAVPLSNCTVTTTRIVRLRTAADTNSDVMTRLPYRTTWRATERTADWFRVVYTNTQGWVSADFVNTTGACDFVPAG